MKLLGCIRGQNLKQIGRRYFVSVLQLRILQCKCKDFFHFIIFQVEKPLEKRKRFGILFLHKLYYETYLNLQYANIINPVQVI